MQTTILTTYLLINIIQILITKHYYLIHKDSNLIINSIIISIFLGITSIIINHLNKTLNYETN